MYNTPKQPNSSSFKIILHEIPCLEEKLNVKDLGEIMTIPLNDDINPFQSKYFNRI